MPGYSGTPLIKKLGITEVASLYLDGAPSNYLELLGPLPREVEIKERFDSTVDIVHVFSKQAKSLAAKLDKYRAGLQDSGVVWVSWPKKAAKIDTDITEDVIRDVALPLGFVDIKVCAVDEIWSGLKLVIRKELRKKKRIRVDSER